VCCNLLKNTVTTIISLRVLLQAITDRLPNWAGGCQIGQIFNLDVLSNSLTRCQSWRTPPPSSGVHCLKHKKSVKLVGCQRRHTTCRREGGKSRLLIYMLSLS
jgi:hypothetical protein